MIRRMASVMFVLGLIAASIALGQGQVQITIDKIESDQYISGFVRGIPAEDTKDFKVVVYVRTDRWYIHPYAQGAEGKSWASIAQDGSWKIETVRREFPASQIAALVVKKDATPPPKTENVVGVEHTAIVVRDLEGTPDHGKL